MTIFYGQSLLAQTNQSGVHVDKCLIVSGENTSSYLSLLDNTGEMLVAINDMSITEHISAEFYHSILILLGRQSHYRRLQYQRRRSGMGTGKRRRCSGVC